MSGAGPRAVALGLLQAVLQRRTALDDVLVRDPGFVALQGRDRSFARNLASTTLRRLGQIDALIDHCLERPLPKSASAVRDVLRLGVVQLAFLRTPAHAAVDSTVALALGPQLAGFRGLINAVLRRLARESDALVAQQDAGRLNTPHWLYQSWVDAYGPETARQIADAHLSEAPLDLSVKGEPAVWAKRLGAEVLPAGSLRLRTEAPIPELPGYAEGAWWVQDVAASLPARVLIGGLDGDARGKRIADLCAAPGGKTAQLAAAGARVTAVDADDARLSRLRENLARLGLEAEIVRANAAEWRPNAAFDGVLLDAPCTGTGTVRRHPDLQHLKTPADVLRLSREQDRLLAAAGALVRRGGVLVYSVCSLQPEEGAARVRDLLASGRGFSRLAVEAHEIGGIDAITADGDVLTLPSQDALRGGMDGFFIARCVA